MKNKKLIIFLLISLIIVLLFFTFYKKPSTAGQIIYEQNSNNPQLYFCPQDNCIEVLTKLTDQSDEVVCAIYNINSEEFLRSLKNKNARVIIDKDYEKNILKYNLSHKTNKEYLMHNKFCVFDNFTVYTGSFNVVKNSDDNNVFIIPSKNLAKNYLEEFNELWNDAYPKKTNNPKINVNGILFESYFCPKDWCAQKIIDAINSANKSITFMTFSFTHDSIADALIAKKNKGILVQGIMEKSQENNFSEYTKLAAAGIDVMLDNGKELMHHKVFVIDNELVISGSMNPTKNGDTKNDENILIVHNSAAAKRFEEEYKRLKNIPLPINKKIKGVKTN